MLITNWTVILQTWINEFFRVCDPGPSHVLFLLWAVQRRKRLSQHTSMPNLRLMPPVRIHMDFCGLGIFFTTKCTKNGNPDWGRRVGYINRTGSKISVYLSWLIESFYWYIIGFEELLQNFYFSRLRCYGPCSCAMLFFIKRTSGEIVWGCCRWDDTRAVSSHTHIIFQQLTRQQEILHISSFS